MTISPLADETARGDADLARAAASGDRTAFAAIYDRYAHRLYDFSIGMLRDHDAAADCVQDVFVTAATRLAQLREPERLRPWLYAIARNEALARIQRRRREHLTEDLPEMADNTAGLETLAARSELAALIDDACGGLSDRDRTVFELAYRHGLDGPELADALGVSHTHANTLVGRLRDTIERSLGALLVSRRARAVANACPELVALLGDWDGRFTVLMRKRVGRHIDNCPTCDDERRRMVNPVALLGSAPVFISAPAWLRQSTLAQFPSAIALSGASVVTGGPQAAVAQHSWWPPQSFDTSDLGVPHSGPAQPMHPGAGPRPPIKGIGSDEAVGAPSMHGPNHIGPEPEQLTGAPTVEALKLGPKFPGDSGEAPIAVPTEYTDSAHGRIGSRTRTALLMALVLLALGTVAVLGTVLVHQLWPPAGPVQTPAPAPAATNAPIPSAPTAPASTPVPPPVTSIPQPQPTTHSRPLTQHPASSAPANPLPAPPPPPTGETPTPTLGPPAPAPVSVIPVPNLGAGGAPAPAPNDSTGNSGGSPKQVPSSSGGSSAGDPNGPPTGGSGGSSPPITHKVFGGGGSNLNNCPLVTGCPTVPNTHGIH